MYRIAKTDNKRVLDIENKAKSWSRYIEDNPNDIMGYENLAITLEALGKDREVVEVWRKYIKQNPEKLSDFPEIPRPLKFKGEMANKAWDLYLEEYANDFSTSYEEASSLKTLNKHMEAIKVLNRHMEHYPNGKTSFIEMYNFAKTDFLENKLVLAYVELVLARRINDSHLLDEIIGLQQTTAELLTSIINFIKENPDSTYQYENFRLFQYFDKLKNLQEKDEWVESLLEDKESAKVINEIVTWGKSHYFKLTGICKEHNKESDFYPLVKDIQVNIASFLMLEDINLLGSGDMIIVDNQEVG